MITPEFTPRVTPLLDELPTEDFLQIIGQRVRQQRARKSMSRKRLAEVSTVSERYLAQLESGQGNMSIALLRKVTSAIGISMGALMAEDVTETCVKKIASVTPQQAASVRPGPDCARQQTASREANDLGKPCMKDQGAVQSVSVLRDSLSVETVDI